MKNQLSKLALVGTTSLLLNVGCVMADSNSTATQPSSTGTPSGTFSDNNKNGQELNSPGADKQKTASMPENSKKTHLKKPTGTQPVANQSPNTATKTPQVSTPVDLH